MRCVNCQNEVPSYASVCPFCGELVKGKPKGAGKELEQKIGRAAKKIKTGDDHGDKGGQGQDRVFSVIKESGLTGDIAEEIEQDETDKALDFKRADDSSNLSESSETKDNAKTAFKKEVSKAAKASKIGELASGASIKASKDIVPLGYLAPLMSLLVGIVLLCGIGFFWYRGKLALPWLGMREQAWHGQKQTLQDEVVGAGLAWSNVYELLPDDTVSWIEYDWYQDKDGKLLDNLKSMPAFIVPPQWLEVLEAKEIMAEIKGWSEWAGKSVVLAANNLGQVSALIRMENKELGMASSTRLLSLLQRQNWEPVGSFKDEEVRVLEKEGAQIAVAHTNELIVISSDQVYALLLVKSSHPNYRGREIAKLREELSSRLEGTGLLRLFVRPNAMRKMMSSMEVSFMSGDALSKTDEYLQKAIGVALEGSITQSAVSIHSIVIPSGQKGTLKSNPRYGPGLVALLPDDASIVFSTSALEGAASSILYNLIAGLFGQSGSIVSGDWFQFIRKIRDIYKLDLSKDIFSWLTQETIISVLSNQEDGLYLDFSPVMLARVDQAKAGAGLRKIENALGGLFNEVLPGHYVVQEKANTDGTIGFEWLPLTRASHFEEVEYLGSAIRYYNISKRLDSNPLSEDFGIYYSLAGNRLIITANLTTIKRVIDVEQKRASALTSKALYDQAQIMLPAKIYGYLYVDVNKVAQTGVLDLLASLLPVGAPGMLGGVPKEIGDAIKQDSQSSALLIYEAGERDVLDTHFVLLKETE